MHSFVLAMLAFPECQSTAQAELDGVIGQDHLPDLADKDNLPYLSALYKEVHRYAPHGCYSNTLYRSIFISRWKTVGPIGQIIIRIPKH